MKSARMGKRLSVRAGRVIANRIGTILLTLFSLSCTIHIQINNTMSSKKKRYFIKELYKGSQGVKMPSDTQTVQDDSMSIKEMLEKHVQGILDPTLVKEGDYHGEDVEHETDTSHLELRTELEALEYAQENGMTEQEINDFLKDQSVPGTVEDVPSTDTEEEATTQDDSE